MSFVSVYERLEELSRDVPKRLGNISLLFRKETTPIVRLSGGIDSELARMSEGITGATDFFYDIKKYGGPTRMEETLGTRIRGLQRLLDRDVYGTFTGHVVPGRSAYTREELPAVFGANPTVHGVLISNRAFVPIDGKLFAYEQEARGVIHSGANETLFNYLVDRYAELHEPIRVLAFGKPGGKFGPELGVFDFDFSLEMRRGHCTYLPIEFGRGFGYPVVTPKIERPHRILERQ